MTADLESRIRFGTVSRADLVARVSAALNGFTATQHISPNHVIEFVRTPDGWRIERIIQTRLHPPISDHV